MTPTVVILTIITYFAMLLGVSWIGSRKSNDNNSFFTGGRKAPWIAVSFAMIGAAMSGVTFISVPAW